mmetsp:Transcript_30828/g.46766  ORF Transcript_30828/g.46766 Transcript_30828/m.46766 type:complete len:586 (+) Transcript_30828:180-1937(+)
MDCIFDLDEDQKEFLQNNPNSKSSSFPKRYMMVDNTTTNYGSTTPKDDPNETPILSSSAPIRCYHGGGRAGGKMEFDGMAMSPMVTKLYHNKHTTTTPSKQLTKHKPKSMDGSELESLVRMASPPPPFLPTLPVEQQQEEQPKQPEDQPSKPNPFYISFLYGFINACIVLPVLMSFANIIYRHDAFGPYLPTLIKLTIVSGIVHQVCFSLASSLPFAIGQVQDAGLIFLSSMAGSMVQYCQSRGYGDEVLLATATIGLSLSTALLGLGLIAIGKLKLAQYVQMLPTPVIGGYLAYIGFFCGMSGIGIMTPKTDDDAITLPSYLFQLPGLVGGISLYIFVRRIRHVAVLPCGIGLLLLGFYVVLAYTETSIADATETGWIMKADHSASESIFNIWQYFQFDKVAWEALPQCCLLTLSSMIFVVALSSSLDVAAIELELNAPLNYNQELCMVGWSNVLSGLTGGYTGSYIFSQTIFSLRAGITSRWSGLCLALLTLTILLLPIPLLAYVPNFFFGSLLLMICVDLCVEWLWEVRHKLTPLEYGIGWTTFGLIFVLGVEFGILAGLVVHVLCVQWIVPRWCSSTSSSS